MTWPEMYARNLTGDDSKGTVDEAFMAKLKEEAVELQPIVKAAWKLRECIDLEWISEQSGGISTKAEDEAKKFFDL